MMDYMVCSSRSVEGLKRLVRDRLKDGWRPQGGACACEGWESTGKHPVTGRAERERVVRLYQAMYRETVNGASA